jgi:hypothetical protein
MRRGVISTFSPIRRSLRLIAVGGLACVVVGGGLLVADQRVSAWIGGLFLTIGAADVFYAVWVSRRPSKTLDERGTVGFVLDRTRLLAPGVPARLLFGVVFVGAAGSVGFWLGGGNGASVTLIAVLVILIYLIVTFVFLRGHRSNRS